MRKSRSAPLMSSTGPWTFCSASAFDSGLAPCTPELKTPMVFTRGSAPSAMERNPPHDCPITATCSRSTLPLSGEPSRAFSFSAHAIALRRSSAFCCRGAAPGSGTLPITRKPCDAIVVKKPE